MTNPDKKVVRVYTDGCFDLFHYGHANSLRQAKQLGTTLIAAIHGDDDIRREKGRAPVLSAAERRAMVAAVRWVDEVLEGATYAPGRQTLADCGGHFVAHGDDNVVSHSGTDPFSWFKENGLFKTFKRTEGVSTTDLIKRIGHMKDGDAEGEDGECVPVNEDMLTSMLASFCSGRTPEARHIIRTDPGHVAFLEAASKEGTFLIVGILASDSALLRPMERALGPAACRVVDKVLVDAPKILEEDFLRTHKVDLVCHGLEHSRRTMNGSPGPKQEDPYSIPNKMGIFKYISSGSNITSRTIIERLCNKQTGISAEHGNSYSFN